MKSLNIKLADYYCDLSSQDIADMQDIIQVGKLAWSPSEKKIVEYSDVPVFRLYTTYDPTVTSNVNPALNNAKWFPLQPAFYRVCAGTGNTKLIDLFGNLVNEAVKLYDKPFSTVSCILCDSTISKHVHSVDPTKNVVTTTFYWCLTDNPLDADFFIEDEIYPVNRQGMWEFNPASPHGLLSRDGNMRFYVLIDNL